MLSDRAAYSSQVSFGTGTASAALSGKAALTGGIDFAGTAGVLTIGDTARFRGTIANGGAASVTVKGGTFGASGADTTTIRSLTVNSGGTLGVHVDGAKGTSSRVIAETATFAEGSKVSATLSSLSGAEGSHTILSAGTLTGAADFDDAATDLPFIFAGAVRASGNDLILDIRRKAADEVGLRRAAAQAYEAIVTAAESDAKMSGDILGIGDAETLQTQFDQLLPDHAGGVFHSVTRASRLVAQHVMEADSTYDISDIDGWLEPVYWRGTKSETDTAAYRMSGWGISTGLERVTGIGRIGLSYAWLKSTIDNNGGTAFSYANEADWKGWLYSGAAGASYDFDIGENFTLRPEAAIDYYRLRENGYTESGGGTAMDLTVEDRTSETLTASTTLTAAYRFGRRSPDTRPLTLELEGGRRNLLSGSLGTTRARFADGEVFAITHDELESSWIAEARVLGGGFDFTWKLAARAERTNGDTDYSGRASLSVAF